MCQALREGLKKNGKFKHILIFSTKKYNIRRYSLLCGLTSSSCGGLLHLAQACKKRVPRIMRKPIFFWISAKFVCCSPQYELSMYKTTHKKHKKYYLNTMQIIDILWQYFDYNLYHLFNGREKKAFKHMQYGWMWTMGEYVLWMKWVSFVSRREFRDNS